MVTVAVLSIVLGIGVPAFQNFVRTNRLAAATNDLISDIAYARGEAVTRSSNVVLCKASTATACDAAGSSWRNGRLIYIDADGNGLWSVGDTALRFREALANSDDVLAGGGDRIGFDRSGLPTSGGNTTYALCYRPGATVAMRRYVRVTATGQARTAVDAEIPIGGVPPC